MHRFITAFGETYDDTNVRNAVRRKHLCRFHIEHAKDDLSGRKVSHFKRHFKINFIYKRLYVCISKSRELLFFFILLYLNKLKI